MHAHANPPVCAILSKRLVATINQSIVELDCFLARSSKSRPYDQGPFQMSRLGRQWFLISRQHPAERGSLLLSALLFVIIIPAFNRLARRFFSRPELSLVGLVSPREVGTNRTGAVLTSAPAHDWCCSEDPLLLCFADK